MITNIQLIPNIHLPYVQANAQGLKQSYDGLWACMPGICVQYEEDGVQKQIVTTESDFFYHLSAQEEHDFYQQEKAQRLLDPSLKVVCHLAGIISESAQNPQKLAERILDYYGIILR